jgi:uncharacterized protein (UPF0276 family)
MRASLNPLDSGAGLGLRLPHLAEVVATRPHVPFFEVHPESFLANPHATELLLQIAEHYPISIHTVGVSVGSASGVDRAHLQRVKALVDRVNPVLLSGHVAWSTHEGEYLNDLLPLPYTDESLSVLTQHINEVQDTFGRPFLLENPSSYVGFVGSTMTEPEFLTELVARTGCRLLVDVSNIHLSAHNMCSDAHAYVRALPWSAVGELHLGGFEVEDDDATAGGKVIIDTHGTVVDDASWALYEYAIERIGSKPTLIERDNDIQDLDSLIHEAQRARVHAEAGVVAAERNLMGTGAYALAG